MRPEADMEPDRHDWTDSLMGIGVIAVYAYSAWIGFEQGVLKGMFMLLVPVVAQLWLCIERGISNPTGFSNLYSWLTILVGCLAFYSIGVKRFGTRVRWLIVPWIGLLVAMMIWHDKGARDPDKVALAFVNATLAADRSLAGYYSDGSLKRHIESIDEASDEYVFFKRLAKLERKEMIDRPLRTELIDRKDGLLFVRIECEIESGVWLPYTDVVLSHADKGWRVVKGKATDPWTRIPARHASK